MSVNKECQSSEQIVDIVQSIRGRGVSLWLEGGALRYRAPRGALTSSDLNLLKASSKAIVELLATTDARESTEGVPLSFSQLAYWNFAQPYDQKTIRQVASATRIEGPLNVDALSGALSVVTKRHEALRTRIVIRHATPFQQVLPESACDFVVEDLSAIPEEQQPARVEAAIERLILDPLDVAGDPLIAVRLLRLNSNEHVLLIAMEHTIADAFSLGVLLHDLLLAYEQITQGQYPSLPPVATQPAEYASWQRRAYQAWLRRDGAQHLERLTNWPVVSFPDDVLEPSAGTEGWGTVPFKIGKSLMAELRELCRQQQTTVPLAVFTAYAATVLRWCGAHRTVIRYQSDGRVRPELEQTIGFFAVPLYLPIELRESDSFADLIKKVMSEYCTAHQHLEFACELATRLPPLPATLSTSFNWIPQTQCAESAAATGAVRCSPVRFQHPMLKNLHPRLRHRRPRNDPSMLLYDFGCEVSGDVYFPRNRFTPRTMERFAEAFIFSLQSLLQSPYSRIKDAAAR